MQLITCPLALKFTVSLSFLVMYYGCFPRHFCHQLDSDNRAMLADFGTCTQFVLTEEDCVGSPIYMAPETVATNQYYGATDIYSFSILFWFICSGDVHLPVHYEACENNHVLLREVRRGLRPERLARFTDLCWELMCQCWQADHRERLPLGEVTRRLHEIKDHGE